MARDRSQPPEGTRRREIVSAALELATIHGFETINLRALALQLGLSTMALYRHVRDKDDLLNAMADRVIGQIELPSRSLRWDEWYVAVTLRYWEAMARYPGLAAYILAHGPIIDTPASHTITDAMLRVLVDAGFDSPEAALLWRTVHAYLSGMAVLPQDHTTDESFSDGLHFGERPPDAVGAILAEIDRAPNEKTLESGLRRILSGFGPH